MKKAFFIFLFSSLFTLTSCKNEINTPIKLQGFVFGTSYNIIYYDVGISFEEEIIQLFEDINNYEDKDEVKQIKDRDYNNSMITKVENYIKNNMTMKNIGEDSEKEEIVVLSLTKLKHFIADANSDSDSD